METEAQGLMLGKGAPRGRNHAAPVCLRETAVCGASRFLGPEIQKWRITLDLTEFPADVFDSTKR